MGKKIDLAPRGSTVGVGPTHRFLSTLKIVLHRIISKVRLPSSLSVTRDDSSHDDEAECVPLSGKRLWTNLVQGIEDRSEPMARPGLGGGTHRLSG